MFVSVRKATSYAFGNLIASGDMGTEKTVIRDAKASNGIVELTRNKSMGEL